MTASTTVRIGSHDKARLADLQAAWRRHTGRAATQQEILGQLLEYAQRHIDAIVDEMAWRPLSEKELDALEREAIDLGHPTDLSSDIDATVYDLDREMGRT